MSGFKNSRESHHGLKADKKLGDLQEEALTYLKEYGPGTTGEIWSAASDGSVSFPMHKADFASRLNELRDRGLAASILSRKCRVSNKTCQIWQVLTPELANSRDYLTMEVERRQNNMDQAQSHYIQAKKALAKAKKRLQLHDTPQGDLFEQAITRGFGV